VPSPKLARTEPATECSRFIEISVDDPLQKRDYEQLRGAYEAPLIGG